MTATFPRRAALQPPAPETWLTLLVERYVRALQADGMPDPLAQPLTVGAVLFDLLQLGEAPVPAVIAELLGATS